MPRKERLIFLHTADTLIGARCDPSLKSRALPRLRRAPCPDSRPESLNAALDSLLDSLAETRPRAANAAASATTRSGSWPEDVRLCLSADAALFRDWSFPFRSASKARQALDLLLETEFPCDAATLAHCVCLTGFAARGKGIRAVSVSLPAGLPQAWQAAFEQRGLSLRLMTVEPFPLLLGLPRLHGASLFLQPRAGYSVLAALDDNVLRRIRVVERLADPQQTEARQDAAALAREAALALDGLPLSPQQLLLCGDAALGGDASAALEAAFELPVRVLGRDLPLPGLPARLNENEAEWLPLLCLAGMPLVKPWLRRLYPAFEQPRGLLGHGFVPGPYKKLFPAAICLLCIALAFLFSVWAEGNARHRQAREVEAQTQTLYRKAVPGARGPASPTRMRSILEDRLAQLRADRQGQGDFPVLRLLRAMHAAVPDKLGVRVERLSLDAKHCRISGYATDYEAVNRLREVLAGMLGVTSVNILSAASRTAQNAAQAGKGAAVRFELDLVRPDRPILPILPSLEERP